MVHVCSCLQLDLRNYRNLSEAGGVSTTDLNKLEELANTLASLLLTKTVSIHLKLTCSGTLPGVTQLEP